MVPVERTVTIPACDQHEGFYSLTVSLPWVCIYCGDERGEPYDGLSYDGSRRLHVSCWKNPCGHVEEYGAIRDWLKKNKNNARRNKIMHVQQPEHDPVTSPSHYTVYPVQPIEITRHLSFCLGNAVKYVLRAPFKNGGEDLMKAHQYLDWEHETPSPLPSFKAYKAIEQATDAIIEYLTLNQTDTKDKQTQFLVLLDHYLCVGGAPLLLSLSLHVNSMIEEGE